MRVYIPLALISLIASPSLWAQAPQPAEVPEPPGIPTDEQRAKAAAEAKQPVAPQADEQTGELPPAVVERTEGDQVITEYWRRGQLYMVRIKPKQGPPQYWLDRDGDGLPESRTEDMENEINLPKWRIGKW